MRLLDPVVCLNGLAISLQQCGFYHEGVVDNHDLVLSQHCMECTELENQGRKLLLKIKKTKLRQVTVVISPQSQELTQQYTGGNFITALMVLRGFIHCIMIQ